MTKTGCGRKFVERLSRQESKKLFSFWVFWYKILPKVENTMCIAQVANKIFAAAVGKKQKTYFLSCFPCLDLLVINYYERWIIFIYYKKLISSPET